MTLERHLSSRYPKSGLWISPLRIVLLVLVIGLSVAEAEDPLLPTNPAQPTPAPPGPVVTKHGNVLARRNRLVLQPRNMNNPISLAVNDPRSYERPINLNIDLACSAVSPSPNYATGKRCKDGADPDPNYINESLSYGGVMSAKWHHPDNAKQSNLDLVDTAKGACSPNCASGICYYSLDYYDYICGNASFAATEAAKLRNIVRLVTVDYTRLDDGRICLEHWTWIQNQLVLRIQVGNVWDPLMITHDDLEVSEWYAASFGMNLKEEMRKLQDRLSVRCKSRNCKFVYERGAFICGGRGQIIRPISVLSLALFVIGAFLIQP